MLYILASWIALFILVTSFGQMMTFTLSRFCSKRTAIELTTFQSFWTGMAVIVAAIQLAHLVVPLNAIVLYIFIALSAIGVPGTLRKLREEFLQIEGRSKLVAISTIAIISILGAAHLSGYPHIGFDTQLYHFNYLQWRNEYPVVFGLGNLHGRLAINSAYLNFSSLIDNLWWDQLSYRFFPGFFPFVACIHWTQFIFGKTYRDSQIVRIFCIVTLPYLALQATNIEPSYYFDGPVHIAIMAFTIELALRYSRRKAETFSNRSHLIHATTICAIAALAFVIKPIGSVTLLSAAILGPLWAFSASRGVGYKILLRNFALVGTIPAILLCSHFTLNAITTGWLLYPAPVGELNVKWALPEHPSSPDHDIEMQSVRGQYDVIRNWARTNGGDYHRSTTEGISFWFAPWFSEFTDTYEFKLFTIGLIALLLSFPYLLKRKNIETIVVLILLASSNLLFWLCTAPATRFGDGFFWSWFAIGIASLLAAHPLSKHYGKMTAFIALGIGLSLPGASFLPKISPTLVIPPQHEIYDTLLSSWHTSTSNEFPIRVPLVQNQCGDSPLPCTPYSMYDLYMFEPGKLSKGFFRSPPVVFDKIGDLIEIREISTTGIGHWEGPYPNWNLHEPVRWIRTSDSSIKFSNDALEDSESSLYIKARPNHPNQTLVIELDGERLFNIELPPANIWFGKASSTFKLSPGIHTIHIANKSNGSKPDGPEVLLIETLALTSPAK